MRLAISRLGVTAAAVVAMTMGESVVLGQAVTATLPATQANPLAESLELLDSRLRELNAQLLELRSELASSRAETAALRKELESTRQQISVFEHSMASRGAVSDPLAGEGAPSPRASEGRPAASQGSTEARLSKLEEDQQLLSAKVDEQYQTKLESASKYRVRFSGIALLNLFSNQGSVDNLDVPTWATPRNAEATNGSFGATVRQSSLGLEVFGPRVAGARSSGELQFDFFGGFPATWDGTTAGLVRMRTATLRLDWARTSIVGGQEAPFFSPLSPTSLASLGTPALAYAGNLWTWTPQLRMEHRFALADESSLTLQAGVLDPLTGEVPASQFFRTPTAGEAARQPAYAARIAWNRTAFGLPLTLGAGGYYSRQDWGFHRHVDAWAGTADWSVPLGSLFSLTGEFYRGRAIGGLGGALARSVLFSGPEYNPASSVLGLNTLGGWAQLKFKPLAKLEFNGAFGEDYPSDEDLHRFASPESYNFAGLAQNQGMFVNGIYHARSNLLLSLEYRRLHTWIISKPSVRAGQVNLSAGVLF
jgi:hypothetical protein